ncbi:MAG: leucyl/phenylalanyl-tRNA--protein transferase, partial [Mangrovicoccus sp.]
GRAFFGESMFSRADNGSKIALAYLTDRLLTQGYILFDTQFITSHLRSLGAIEITRMQYHQRLARALQVRAEFPGGGPMASAQEVLQRKSQTS